MKKLFSSFLVFLLISLMFTSCVENQTFFDESLLFGKWQEFNMDGSTLNFEVYNVDGTGYTWDEADDVTEAEAQPFTWELNQATLMQIHIMEGGQKIPKVYTLTKLTNSELSYKDDFGGTHDFIKVN